MVLIVRSAYQNNLTPIEITLDNSDRILEIKVIKNCGQSFYTVTINIQL